MRRDESELDARARNAVRDAAMHKGLWSSIDETPPDEIISSLSEMDLLKTPNCGRQTIKVVGEYLNTKGMSFAKHEAAGNKVDIREFYGCIAGRISEL